jgi:dolichol-phosphate mannosyltransferase
MERIRSACIVLPTYNEAGNIISILDRIFSHAKSMKDVQLHVLVVDDSSPDGTAKLAQGYARKNKRVHVLVRAGKEGLGAAYIAGMRHAMETLHPDVIMEMDADGSHNPKDVPRLIRAVQDGADFVIGSRYIPGGSIPQEWGFYRKLNSKVANGLVRTVLGMRPRDCTGGFRAIRTSFLEQVEFDKLHSKGYAFQISLLKAVSDLGGIITEVPIQFTDRKIGTSKMRLKDQVEFIILTFRIRLAHLVVPRRQASARVQSARKIPSARKHK